MNKKKWTTLFFLSLIIYIISFSIVILIINPTNAYNYGINNILSFEPKYYHHKYTSKVFFEKLKENKYSLSFGTSRSYRISKEITNSKTLNIGSLYANPFSVLNFIKSLSKQQVDNIDTIFYMIDVHTNKEKEHYKYGYRYVNYNNYALSFINYFFDYILNTKSLYDTINYFKYKVNQPDRNYISINYGNVIDKKILTFNFNNHTKKQIEQITFLTEYPDYYKYDQSAVKALKQIHDICKEKNIKIVYYTSTLSLFHLDDLNFEYEYKKYSEILSAVEEIHYMEYIEGISDFIENKKLPYFSDPSHLNIIGLKKMYDEYLLTNKYLVKNKSQLRQIINYNIKKQNEKFNFKY